MVSFSKLRIRNFKRFAGNHEITLQGDGRVTVIAAENGVGKTTMMDAIHIGLYGKRGFDFLYPDEDFEGWLNAAYSVDAEGDRHILLSLEMKDQILGQISITRTFWLLGEEYGGLEEEVGVEIDGKQLEREAGESRSGLAEKWLEDYLPHSAMRRFLVDGERLSDLDPKNINDEIVRGIDDVIGIGLLHKMRKRLNSVRRKTLREQAPKEKGETLEGALDMLEENENSEVIAISELNEHRQRASLVANRISEIQEEIESITKKGGEENVQLRMRYAVSQSELTSSRREILKHLMGPLPLILAGIPIDIEDWSAEQVLESKYSQERVGQNLKFLRTVVEESGIGEEPAKEILKTGDEVSSRNAGSSEIESPLSPLPLKAVEEALATHSKLRVSESDSEVKEAVQEAIRRLDGFLDVEESLREATRGTGVGLMAEELRSLSTELGTKQALIASLKGKLERIATDKIQIVSWIGKLKQNDDPRSRENLRLGRLEDLDSLCTMVMKKVRSEFAEPLESAFSEGFELLSRKAGKLEGVRIDTSDYSTHLSMKGFDGNWLDRGLSATERQHVGLALVYALRRASTKWSLPLPVVVDTPTSRMDRKHKSWSVTQFYPQLSNQVIVFATSDDLADGLFEELRGSGSLGAQMVIREVSDNSVEVVESDLSPFFGGE